MIRAAVPLLALAALVGLWLWARTDLSGAETIASKRLPTEQHQEHPPVELAGAREESAPPAIPAASGVDGAPDVDATPAKRAEVRTPAKPVLLFEHADHDVNFPGRRWFLQAGFHTSPTDFEGDQASTVRVPDGWRLVLYDQGDHSGARVVLGPGQHNLAPYGFNDRASSARVLREGEPLLDEVPLGPDDGVVLYERRPSDGEPGLTWRLLPEEGRASTFVSSRAGVFDPHAVSAVWIPTGLELTLFREPDGRGPAMVLGPGFHELSTVGFDNVAQSVRIRREEP